MTSTCSESDDTKTVVNQNLNPIQASSVSQANSDSELTSQIQIATTSTSGTQNETVSLNQIPPSAVKLLLKSKLLLPKHHKTDCDTSIVSQSGQVPLSNVDAHSIGRDDVGNVNTNDTRRVKLMIKNLKRKEKRSKTVKGNSLVSTGKQCFEKNLVSICLKSANPVVINPVVNLIDNPGVNSEVKPEVNLKGNSPVSTGKECLGNLVSIYPKSASPVMINPEGNLIGNLGLNSEVNPEVNQIVNPGVNSVKTPGFNPAVNSQVNPIVTAVVNPKVNRVNNPGVSPAVNSGVNPAVNPGVSPVVMNPSLIPFVITPAINPMAVSPFNPFLITPQLFNSLLVNLPTSSPSSMNGKLNSPGKKDKRNVLPEESVQKENNEQETSGVVTECKRKTDELESRSGDDTLSIKKLDIETANVVMECKQEIEELECRKQTDILGSQHVQKLNIEDNPCVVIECKQEDDELESREEAEMLISEKPEEEDMSGIVTEGTLEIDELKIKTQADPLNSSSAESNMETQSVQVCFKLVEEPDTAEEMMLDPEEIKSEPNPEEDKEAGQCKDSPVVQDNPTLAGINSTLGQDNLIFTGINSTLGQSNPILEGINNIPVQNNSILASINSILGQNNPTLSGINSILNQNNPTLAGINSILNQNNPTLAGINSILNQNNPTLAGINSTPDQNNPTIPGINSTLGQPDQTIVDLNSLLPYIGPKSQVSTDTSYSLLQNNQPILGTCTVPQVTVPGLNGPLGQNMEMFSNTNSLLGQNNLNILGINGLQVCNIQTISATNGLLDQNIQTPPPPDVNGPVGQNSQNTKGQDKQKVSGDSGPSKGKKRRKDSLFSVPEGETIVVDPKLLPPIKTKQEREKKVSKRLEVIGDKYYKCGICQETFSNAEHFEMHVRDHLHKTGDFMTCAYCKKNFREVSIVKHMKTVHKLQVDSRRSAKESVNLIVVRKDETGGQVVCVEKVTRYTYECTVCRKLFQTPSDLQRHNLRCFVWFFCISCRYPVPEREKGERVPADRMCLSCRKKEEKQKRLKEEKQKKTSADCRLKEEEQKRLKKEKQKKLKEEKRKKLKEEKEKKSSANCRLKEEKEKRPVAKRACRNKRYKCEECGKFYKKNVYEDHLKSQHGQIKLFNCDACDKSYSTRASLCSHKTKHRCVKQLCDICGATFRFPTSLDKHKKRVHSPKAFGCEVCGRRFTYKHFLKYHMKLHSKEKPFLWDVHKPLNTYYCDTCKKYLKDARTLLQHKIYHKKVGAEGRKEHEGVNEKEKDDSCNQGSVETQETVHVQNHETVQNQENVQNQETVQNQENVQNLETVQYQETVQNQEYAQTQENVQYQETVQK